jgi:hypothetical protein
VVANLAKFSVVGLKISQIFDVRIFGAEIFAKFSEANFSGDTIGKSEVDAAIAH